MEKLIIEGGTPLRGSVKVSGSKNSALPILASTILWPGIYSFHNVPDIKDVRTMLDLLKIFRIRVSLFKKK